jgi:hypothetical protein
MVNRAALACSVWVCHVLPYNAFGGFPPLRKGRKCRRRPCPLRMCYALIAVSTMMEDIVKRILLIAISLLISSNVVFAQAKHPVWVAQIDAQWPSAKLSPAERAQVVRLRNQGEREHNAGNHGAAEVSLGTEYAEKMIRPSRSSKPPVKGGFFSDVGHGVFETKVPKHPSGRGATVTVPGVNGMLHSQCRYLAMTRDACQIPRYAACTSLLPASSALVPCMITLPLSST